MAVELTKFDYLDPKQTADKLAAGINAAGGGGGGTTLIRSGKITTPVKYFDVALPSGYFGLTITVSGVAIGGDSLSGAFSSDGGSSFFCDVVNSDTYIMGGLVFSGSSGASSGSFLVGSLVNSLMAFDQIGPDSVVNRYVLNIETGTALESFVVSAQSVTKSLAAGQVSTCFCSFMLNANAVAAPVYSIVNLIRFVPYGNGDCDPPTSEETITAGSWTLFGIPTPA